MEESVTYQAIVAKGVRQGVQQGAVEELKKTLLLQGRKRFGEPNARAQRVVEGLNDLGRLEQLSLRLLDVGSWQELLDLPQRTRRKVNP